MKSKNRLIPIIVVALVLTVLIAWLGGAFHEKIPPQKQALHPESSEGKHFQVKSVAETTTETATGTINARDETTVSTRILAAIQRFRVKAGDTITEGQVLLELDDRDLRSRFEQIKQSLLAARALLQEADAEYQRVKTLYEKKVASRADFDRVRAAHRSREANYQRVVRELEEAKTTLSFTIIRSPIAGKVVERLAEPGDTAIPGKPLLRIYNPDLLRLDAQVRESLAAGLHVGDRLHARIDALNREVPVIIDEIVPSADPGSRSITVKALLPADDTLYPGMFGRLVIPTGTLDRIYIPNGAVSRMGQLEFVSVMDRDRVARRFIRTGHRKDDGSIEVLSGLQTGEVIILTVPGNRSGLDD